MSNRERLEKIEQLHAAESRCEELRHGDGFVVEPEYTEGEQLADADNDIMVLQEWLLLDAKKRLPEVAEALRGIEDDWQHYKEQSLSPDLSTSERALMAMDILGEHIAAVENALINEYFDAAWLTVQDIADRAGVGRVYVNQEIKAGRLPALKIGRAYSIKTVDFYRWMENPRRGSRKKSEAADK